SGTPAWATIPSWDIVGLNDHIITPAEQLLMAHRANAHITEINAPHLSMISNPGVVASVIIQAARPTGCPWFFASAPVPAAAAIAAGGRCAARVRALARITL